MISVRLSYVIALIGVFTVFVLVECRWYQNGLIFYDLSTKKILLPPTVSVHRNRGLQFANIPIFSKLGQPCTCKGLKCGCCAGLQVKEYEFDQKLCANVTFVPEKEEALLDVFLNEESQTKYGISARNPSPVCVPIMMPLPMAACIQMSQVGLKGDNLHMCMDFVMRLHTTDAMELHFNCLSMGLDGFQYLDPNGNPVFPKEPAIKNDNTIDDENDEYYDSEEETSQEDEIREEEEDKNNQIVVKENSNNDNNLEENNANETEFYEDPEYLEGNEDEETTEQVSANDVIRVYETL